MILTRFIVEEPHITLKWNAIASSLIFLSLGFTLQPYQLQMCVCWGKRSIWLENF